MKIALGCNIRLAYQGEKKDESYKRDFPDQKNLLET
jgi:hypothetical protein